MRIPFDAIISPEKLNAYLLVERPWDDKSKFLARADFNPDNAQTLDFAIRQLAVSSDAHEDGSNEYGTFYRVTGALVGPNGLSLQVVLIWLQWKSRTRVHYEILLALRPNCPRS